MPASAPTCKAALMKRVVYMLGGGPEQVQLVYTSIWLFCNYYKSIIDDDTLITINEITYFISTALILKK